MGIDKSILFVDAKIAVLGVRIGWGAGAGRGILLQASLLGD
jgi:hypothetical protein